MEMLSKGPHLSMPYALETLSPTASAIPSLCMHSAFPFKQEEIAWGTYTIKASDAFYGFIQLRES
jgi:hypothetical protein